MEKELSIDLERDNKPEMIASDGEYTTNGYWAILNEYVKTKETLLLRHFRHNEKFCYKSGTKKAIDYTIEHTVPAIHKSIPDVKDLKKDLYLTTFICEHESATTFDPVNARILTGKGGCISCAIDDKFTGLLKAHHENGGNIKQRDNYICVVNNDKVVLVLMPLIEQVTLDIVQWIKNIKTV